jgi:hypothetical protein
MQKGHSEADFATCPSCVTPMNCRHRRLCRHSSFDVVADPAPEIAPEASPCPKCGNFVVHASTCAAPVRVQILNEGASLTSGERDKVYGDPAVNLRCAMELKQVYDKYAVSPEGDPRHGLAHHEAMHMALTKVGRIATGAYKKDNYVDGATYTAIAGEQGEKAT